jgi:hypothetical protein
MKARFQPMDLMGWLLLIAFVMALLLMVGLGSSLLGSRS